MVFDRSNRRGARVSLYDVAAAAGVSHQTVSNVLNYPERVRPATRERVKAAVLELGYEVNVVARSLGAGRTNVVGLQVPRRRPGETVGFFEHFILELADAARARERNILIFSSDEDGVAEPVRLHRSRLIDGVIVADTLRHDQRIRELTAAGIPFVAFGRTAEPGDHPWVDVDNRHAMELCVRHLVATGHRQIGYLDSGAGTFYGHERREGFLTALSAAGIPATAAQIVTLGTDLVEARARTAALLGGESPPTAVIAGSDYLAATVVDAAHGLGVTVGPEGLGLVGFDDTALASLLVPSLTTVQQPVPDAARLLVDALVARIAGRDVENHLLKPRLMLRDSA